MSRRGRRRERPQKVVRFDGSKGNYNEVRAEVDDALDALESALKRYCEMRRKMLTYIAEMLPKIQEEAGLSEVKFEVEDGFYDLLNAELPRRERFKLYFPYFCFSAVEGEYTYGVAAVLTEGPDDDKLGPIDMMLFRWAEDESCDIFDRTKGWESTGQAG